MAKQPSLDDKINTTSGVKGNPPFKPSDTVHVNSDRGYPMVVKRGSAYHKQAQSIGAVPTNLRPGGARTENTDTFSVKNYNKRYKK